MSRYSKFFVAAAGVLGVLASVLSDGVVAPEEYETVAVAVATAVGVFFVRNKPAA